MRWFATPTCLHRNFQGYSTQPEGDLIGLGASAIARVGATYSQNAASLREFEALAPLVECGLVQIDAHAIEVTPPGGYVVRALAMVFDRNPRADIARERSSRAI